MIRACIKFVGLNKAESIHKAFKYYHWHHQGMSMEDFLAKCRLQKDGITIHYYPDLKIEKVEVKENNENKKESIFARIKRILCLKN